MTAPDTGIVVPLHPDQPHLQKDPAIYRPQPTRQGGDYWPTIDPDLIRMLLQEVLPRLPPGVIWEFAAGQGHLVDPLRQAGRTVIATDLYPGRDDIATADFRYTQPIETIGALALTNPPNTLLTEIIARGLALIGTGRLRAFVLLTRQGADTADERAIAWNTAAYEWKTCWRPWWKERHPGEKTPRFAAQWTAWLAGHTGPPLTERIKRSQLRSPELPLAPPRSRREQLTFL